MCALRKSFLIEIFLSRLGSPSVSTHKTSSEHISTFAARSLNIILINFVIQMGEYRISLLYFKHYLMCINILGWMNRLCHNPTISYAREIKLLFICSLDFLPFCCSALPAMQKQTIYSQHTERTKKITKDIYFIPVVLL